MRQVNAAMLSADADGDGKISYQARVAARLPRARVHACGVQGACACLCARAVRGETAHAHAMCTRPRTRTCVCPYMLPILTFSPPPFQARASAKAEGDSMRVKHA